MSKTVKKPTAKKKVVSNKKADVFAAFPKKEVKVVVEEPVLEVTPPAVIVEETLEIQKSRRFNRQSLWLIYWFILGLTITFMFYFFFSHLISSASLFSNFKKPEKVNIDYYYTGEYENSFEAFRLLKQLLDPKTGKSLKIVDLRTSSEYSEGHIKKAINIPLYEEVNKGEKLAIYEQKFKDELKKFANKNSPVIIYAHSSSEKLPEFLAEKMNKQGYHLLVLTIGWNEWRHFTNLWIPENEWGKVNINDYVEGKE